MTYIYQELDKSYFIDRFKEMGRGDNFTYSGLSALYDWLEELAENTGEPYKLDVIALCCEFCEYSEPLEAVKEYGLESDLECHDGDSIELLNDHTLVIELETGGVIVQGF